MIGHEVEGNIEAKEQVVIWESQIIQIPRSIFMGNPNLREREERVMTQNTMN